MNSVRGLVARSAPLFLRRHAGPGIVASIGISSESSSSSDESSRTTHFGFETVTEAEKSGRVYGVFKNVAKNYDIMNDAMSLGIHRLWKDSLLDIMKPTPGTRLLDVAGGTGDISFRFLECLQRASQRRANASSQNLTWEEIAGFYRAERPGDWDARGAVAVVCDINKEMLRVGQKRAEQQGFSEGLMWVVGNAEELPFADSRFDIYSIAFGIRNVTHISIALEEAYRVLRPGGRFLCLEFSKVTNPILQRLYDLYSFQVIPVLGEVIAKDWKSYQYLVESIRQFPDQEVFKSMIEDAGFRHVTYRNLTNGIVAVHSGFKI
ncbi:2-methoxy-6-polyprenyl-1,4-benzoquinol methylase, mitochondrial [Lethenteron reissneri]|uniref:2-methoxy-6-polyprenyl-1,4-benzoquinol methylase, mitochondrial n=1 Tax=Lethenteron reissneri TaxID=7753 RepID=UPI002AB6F0E7|nr:2-methoxy-6-polyprenyl-1,4-benzoquinol methylase, mitochondrial [Lethenteron reissneri]